MRSQLNLLLIGHSNVYVACGVYSIHREDFTACVREHMISEENSR